jgi:hypothetical protein
MLIGERMLVTMRDLETRDTQVSTPSRKSFLGHPERFS